MFPKKTYKINNKESYITFLLQITSLSNEVDNKIKETYLQSHYTNDVKLKIRFSKKLKPELRFLGGAGYWPYFGNDKNITIDLNALGVLGMINNSDNPVKITITPR